jgi:antitoxin component YwqK of YwqJK toxin-antitoxin module
MIHSTKEKSTRIKNGKWKEFNKYAILISEGIYVNDKKHGCWREYYDHTGSLMIEETYENGTQHGAYTCFHPNGHVWSMGYFNNGLREGYFRTYDEQGNCVKNILFISNNQIEDIEELKTLK